MPSQTRQLSVVTDLAPGALTLVGLTGREALSEPTTLQLDLVAGSSTPIPFDRILGRAATVGVGGGRFFHGIVSRLSEGRRDRTSVSYNAELVPHHQLLALRSRSRIFQDRSAPDIARQVLEDNGLGATFRLEGSYPEHDYAAQYNETDFAFLQRVVLEEAIFYFFEHGADGHELVLGDGPSAYRGVGTFPFDDGKPRASSPLACSSWEKTQELTLGQGDAARPPLRAPGVAARGHARRSPRPSRRARSRTGCGFPAASSLELYDYPGGYAERFDGVGPAGRAPAGLAQARPGGRRPSSACRRRRRAASSSPAPRPCRALAPGRDVQRSRGTSNGDGALPADRRAALGLAARRAQTAAAASSYANSFTCIPAGVPFRPRTTAEPAVGGTARPRSSSARRARAATPTASAA